MECYRYSPSFITSRWVDKLQKHQVLAAKGKGFCGLRCLMHYHGLPKGKQNTLCYGFEGPPLPCLICFLSSYALRVPMKMGSSPKTDGYMYIYICILYIYILYNTFLFLYPRAMKSHQKRMPIGRSLKPAMLRICTSYTEPRFGDSRCSASYQHWNLTIPNGIYHQSWGFNLETI
jgi:hypothetical protein